jgi:hypothetical protein
MAVAANQAAAFVGRLFYCVRDDFPNVIVLKVKDYG